MALIPFITLAEILSDAGFPAGAAQQKGCAVVASESGRNPAATHINYKRNADGSYVLDANGNKIVDSIDRGMWQINDKAHPEVSDEDAFDPVASTKAALRISTGGTNYSPWVGFSSGAYQAHMEAAAVALDGAAKLRKLQASLDGVKTSLASTQAKLSDAQAALTKDEAKINAARAALA